MNFTTTLGKFFDWLELPWKVWLLIGLAGGFIIRHIIGWIL